MSSETTTPSDDGAPTGVWRTISPRFAACPDWAPAGRPRLWPAGVALLFVFGMAGSLGLLAVSLLAARTGYVHTLEDTLADMPLVEQWLVVVLVAPAIEEVLFRLSLTPRPRLGVLTAAGALGSLNFAFGNAPAQVVAAMFALVAVLAGVVWLQSLLAGTAAEQTGPRPATWQDCLDRWWSDHPRWPVWCSVGAFAMVHLANYEVSWSLVTVAVAPLVVGPQLWLGLMFTIARVRYRWWAALALHALHNFAVWSATSALR